MALAGHVDSRWHAAISRQRTQQRFMALGSHNVLTVAPLGVPGGSEDNHLQGQHSSTSGWLSSWVPTGHSGLDRVEQVLGESNPTSLPEFCLGHLKDMQGCEKPQRGGVYPGE